MNISKKVSVIIPARGERFLRQTVDSLFDNASGDIEVIVVLDGAAPLEPLNHHPGLDIISLPYSLGMRAAINAGADVAQGEFLMKLDGHCLVSPGWDEWLENNCDLDTVAIPRRYSLDAENWRRQEGRPIRDYHYLCYPNPFKGHDRGMHGVEWEERKQGRGMELIDDNMCFQGSCWFMHKRWFTDFLGGMDENTVYAGWAQEPTEISLKTWLGGGRVIVNKLAWYAHLHKGKQWGRGYQMPDGVVEGHNYAADQWMSGAFNGKAHPLDWLIEKFWPVPTWPENWRQEYAVAMARFRGILPVPAAAHRLGA